jgi:predicted ATPase
VDQRALVERAWPQLHIEESNLRVHIRALRRALSSGEAQSNYIVNVPGRGYRFAAPISVVLPAAEQTELPAPRFNLPAPLGRMIGRQDVLDQVIRRLLATRFVTLLGAGGTGKTTVAIAVANQMLARFAGVVCFVDLSGVGDPRLTAAAIASALHIQIQDADPVPTIIDYLKRTPTLIILDCCEPVIHSAAELAERLYLGSPSTHILATSREPLRVEGEQVHNLPALDAPSENVTADDVYSFPAAELLLERATAAGARIEDTEANAMAVAEICRRLDGIPLAIELAAARVTSYGVEGVATRLDDRFQLLNQGRRTAPERHRTLRSVIDWSYALLSESERDLLCQLSQFVGRFTLDAAITVCANDNGNAGIENAIAELIAKSMVIAEPGPTPVFRLLDTTIAYGQEKLRQSSKAPLIARRHAEYFADLLNGAWRDRESLFERGGYAPLAYHLGNVRLALKWCFCDEGDAALGVLLAAGAGIYLVELGLFLEAYEWTGRALELIDDKILGTKKEAILRYAFAHGAVVIKGNHEIASKAMADTLETSETLKEYDIIMRTLGGMHIFVTRTNQYAAGQRISARAQKTATEMNDEVALAMAECMMCHDHHYLGDQAKAESYRASVFRRTPPQKKINTIRMGLDQRVRMLAVESRLFWLLGRNVEALESARRSLAFSDRDKNPVVAVMAYQGVATTAMLCGEWELMGEVNARMRETAIQIAIRPFPEIAAAYEAERLFQISDPGMPVGEHYALFEALRKTGFNLFFLANGMIQHLLKTKRASEAANLLRELRSEVERSGQNLFLPEFLRLEADILLAQVSDKVESAEALYQRAAMLAHEQSAFGWQLRAAVALARLHQAADPAQSRAILLPVLERFADGYVTPDIAAARDILQTLA